MIPFVNLERQITFLKPQILAAVEAVLDDRSFIQGPRVAQFEKLFAAAHDAPFAVGCSNGTAAISLTLEGLGIGCGDEVILPAHTFAATGAAIRHVGATPVFAEIERETYTIDAADVQRRLTPRTKAIIPVHLYGTPCRLGELSDVIASRPDIVLIEDCAQAHLACYRGRPVGTFGKAASFSFYPGKNLGACGDAGAILTSDEKLANTLRKLRDHGRRDKHLHELVGYNHRMDEIQAAILLVKLPFLASWTARRQAAARYYDIALTARGFKVITPFADTTPVYHLYVVEVANRNEVCAHLSAKGIITGIHYPRPLHCQPAFAALCRDRLPLTEAITERVMSLPICGNISHVEQDEVIAAFLDVARP